MPSYSIVSLRVLAIAKYFHAFVVQTIRLGKVQNIELHFQSSPRVRAPEEIPLSVTIRVDIVLKHKVVLIVTHFHRCKQISSLEPTFEN